MAINPNLFAGLGPFAGLTQAGTEMASRGIGTLFGIKDPEMERRRVLSQLDYNDPASMQAAAQELARGGFIDQAVALAGQARQMQQQERTFGLREREVGVTEARAKAEAEDKAGRLKLSEEELKLRLKELDNRKDLTKAQINEINARIKTLGKGNYSIREQKGGITGTETIAFVAVNEKDPTDIITIPVTPAAPPPPPPPPAGAGAKPSANRPPLGSFGETR